MSSAGSQPKTKSDEDIGTPFVRVRLDEPFDQIVANNPDLRIEQTWLSNSDLKRTDCKIFKIK